MKKVLPLILALTILLTACGSKATPTIDAASVQASAVAMAFTMAAQTQAALPSPTPVPPTATATVPPPASPTPFSLPTFAVPSATKASAGPCYSALPADPTGRKAQLRIVNENKSSVQGSICLYKDMGFGEYGIIGVQLGKRQDTTLSVPQGCYSAYFWVNGPPQSTASGSGMCMNNSDLWIMYIRENVVVLKGP